METKPRRRIFGPLLYGTIVLAFLVIIGLRVQDHWAGWHQYWALRSYAGELGSPDLLVRVEAQNALVNAGEAGVPWLVEAVGDRDSEVRLRAVSALTGKVVPPRSATPAFLAGLRDQDPRVRRASASALCRFPGDPGDVSEALVRALEDEDLEVRLSAAFALGRGGGPQAGRAVRALLALIGDPAPSHLPDRPAVAAVLRLMTGDEVQSEAVEELIPLIASKSIRLRRAAIESLEKLAPRARPATPALERALEGEDRIARCLAALALSEIEGRDKGRARTSLKALVADPTLPAGLQARARWAAESDFVNGSEISAPVHVLREIVAELRGAEARPDVAPDSPGDEDPTPEMPRGVRTDGFDRASCGSLR